MAKIMLRIIWYFLIIIFFVQCSNVPLTHFYLVDYEMPNSDSHNSPIPLTLGIKKFEADILYNEDRIVYRHSPYEVQYYHYRRWIAPPRTIVREMVIKQFQSSGIFKRMVNLPSTVKTDYVLTGKIKAFEEWDKGDSWFGVVTLAFELMNTKTEAIVWKNEFTKKTRALKKEPVEVVKAISKSLQEVVQNAIDEIKQKLKSKK